MLFSGGEEERDKENLLKVNQFVGNFAPISDVRVPQIVQNAFLPIFPHEGREWCRLGSHKTARSREKPSFQNLLGQT